MTATVISSSSFRGWMGILTLILIALLIMPQTGQAAQRKVLFEDFTSTTCRPCAVAAPAINGALEAVGREYVTPIAIHVWWPAAGDPWYDDNANECRARVNYYGVNAVPWLNFDGTRYAGNLPPPQQALINLFNSRLQAPSPLTMEVTGDIRHGFLNARVVMTPETDIRNAVLYVALTEEYYHFDQPPPNGLRDHYDAMLKMLPNANGTVVNLDANQQLASDFSQAMEGIGWHHLRLDNLILVAWLQAANHEVLQSADYFLDYTSPYLAIEEWSFRDQDGDNRPEAGEETELLFTVANDPEFLDAAEITITVTADDEGVEFSNNTFQLNELAAGASADNDDNPFRFRLSDDFQAHPVTFTFTINAWPDDFENVLEYTTMLDWPPILMVDATNNDRVDELVVEFGTGNLPWCDRWIRTEQGIVSYFDAQNYDAVIWHSFNNADDVITDFEISELQTYLREGGIVVFNSSEGLLQLRDHTFLRDYLKVTVESDQAAGMYIRGYDVPHFSGTRLLLVGGLANPLHKPTLTAREGARPALYYFGNNQDAGIAAVEYLTPQNKALTIAFPTESIGGGVDREYYYQFMERVWNWIQGCLDVPNQSGVTPVQFSLGSAFPNPFNAGLTIPFSLDRRSLVQLGLYDLNGRQRTVIQTGMLPAGQHSFSLNADDLGLAAGVYYLQLRSEGRSAGQKVVFLK